jgi:long-chain acyl-CoA synthetase
MRCLSSRRVRRGSAGKVAARLPRRAGDAGDTGAVAFEDWLEILPEHPGPVQPAPMGMIYTSRTTGVPKGVRRLAQTPEQTVVLEALRAEIYPLKPGIRALLFGPLYHSAPNSFGLRSGKIADLLVLVERFDPEALLQIIEREAIDTVFMVPTMFIRLLKLQSEVRGRYDVSSLRHVIHAAAPCPADVKAAMLKWWRPIIYEFYGGTESGPVSFATPEDAPKKPGTVGRASPRSAHPHPRRGRQGGAAGDRGRDLLTHRGLSGL